MYEDKHWQLFPPSLEPLAEESTEEYLACRRHRPRRYCRPYSYTSYDQLWFGSSRIIPSASPDYSVDSRAFGLELFQCESISEAWFPWQRGGYVVALSEMAGCDYHTYTRRPQVNHHQLRNNISKMSYRLALLGLLELVTPVIPARQFSATSDARHSNRWHLADEEGHVWALSTTELVAPWVILAWNFPKPAHEFSKTGPRVAASVQACIKPQSMLSSVRIWCCALILRLTEVCQLGLSQSRKLAFWRPRSRIQRVANHNSCRTSWKPSTGSFLCHKNQLYLIFITSA